eukprot:gnl/MRDRNA2_/MRDRNA2_30621_c0_seq1.p1 gnl/MRDRNA2_/MRDRNA2_30621_c0~~gnl/MRDRNA2_/MRDRNA2_30621_c0_seq1.p1  ORF type:complete len:291 (+),score=69.09 gnl/MRDRNA2_/MRDRNA2_30621_c0_seq1:94-966(+)
MTLWPWVMGSRALQPVKGSFNSCCSASEAEEHLVESVTSDPLDDEMLVTSSEVQSLHRKVKKRVQADIQRGQCGLEQKASDWTHSVSSNCSANSSSVCKENLLLYEDAQQQTAIQGLKVVFESEGVQHPVLFTQLPLGLIFHQKLPMVVDKTFDMAAQLGVQAGWVVKSVNDQDIDDSDMTYDQVVELINKGKEKLPSNTELKVVFESNDEQHTIVFTEKPLGLTFKPELPLVVEEASEATKRMGVKEGWVVKRINNQDVSDCSMSVIDLVQFMKVLSEKLRPAPAVCMF